MPPRLSLSILAGVLGVVFLGVALLSATPAAAMCEPGDFVCRKFSNSAETKRQSSSRSQSRARSAPRAKTRTTAPVVAKAPVPEELPETENPVRTTMAGPIVLSPAPVQVTTLSPGSIEEAPKDLSTLVFGSNDRIESATAVCQAAKHSLRRVDCTLAMHRLALTSGIGNGCLATLKVRAIELAKDASGRWRHEEAIALCGGRLIRETEFFPVAVNGQPQFALRERYEMIGGNQDCAAPYLATRRPLDREFMPLGHERTQQLSCGTVTAR